MKKFILAYYGQPNFTSAEEAKEHQALWMRWAEELGDAIVNPGTPAKPGKVVTKDAETDTEADAFNGYTIVQAETLEEAVGIARKCPFVVDGGTMSVHEAVDMQM